MTAGPVRLRPVQELRTTVEQVLREVRADLDRLVPGSPVEHIGATALPDGFTKGDLDVNLRVAADQFDGVVERLSARFEIAQPQNWTPTYASFNDSGRALPAGIQVTVEGSPDDFLVALRDRLLADEPLRREYERVKRDAAPSGPGAYWSAKDAFLGRIRE